jgi:hypothetical protein
VSRMPVVYDLSITNARRVVATHRPRQTGTAEECTAGCGHWPCKRFTVAFSLITRNSKPLGSR